MNLLSRTDTKKFNLLSIGQRGVGKTVFLAGSYIELHGDRQTERSGQLWFDCQDTQVQENIERILSYIFHTGQYPPPTIKVTNFSFSLKRHSFRGVQTLSHFRWSDIPGEICNMHNVDFREMVSTSHGCCVFIDAYVLVHNHAYLQELKDIIEQVMAIASLVCLNRLNYPFALILTKCDLLAAGSISQQQLEKGLQPLIIYLDAVKANYQTFYSLIPIVHTEGASSLQAKGAAVPILWLVWELSLAHNPGLTNNLLELVTLGRLSGFQLGQEGVEQAAPSLFRPADKAPQVKKILGLPLLPTARRNLLLLSLAIVGLVLAAGLFWVNYKRVLERQPNNLDVRQSTNIDTLKNLDTLRQRGQFDQAVPLMEKLVQQEPSSLELRLQLARLYELTGQVTRAETAYDQILAQEKNNFKALVGKALLRQAQGDTKTASVLFAQAEKAAPTDLKAQVRAVAQKSLRLPSLPTPSAK